MNVMFVSLSDRPELSEKIYEQLEKYCLYHNYDFVIEKSSLDTSRAASWSKILLLKRELKNNPNRDIVVWIDDDILITNHQLRFEDLIKPYDFENILLSEEIVPPFNCGILVCKNNQETIDYLDGIWERGKKTKYIQEPNWEQQIMIDNYKPDDTILKTIPYRVIQSFYRCGNKDWCLGDFSCHLTGMPLDKRIKYRDEILKQISN
jgi:hypothetical protein